MIENIDEFIEKARISLLEYYCKNCGEENQHNFYPRHKGMCKQCNINSQKLLYASKSKSERQAWYNSNLIDIKLKSAKKRCEEKGLEFNITKEDILFLLKQQNNRCYYSDIEFDNTNKLYSYSIDRTDSTKGYTLDNIKLMCSSVNRMKNNLNEELFLNILKKIVKKLS